MARGRLGAEREKLLELVDHQQQAAGLGLQRQRPLRHLLQGQVARQQGGGQLLRFDQVVGAVQLRRHQRQQGCGQRVERPAAGAQLDAGPVRLLAQPRQQAGVDRRRLARAGGADHDRQRRTLADGRRQLLYEGLAAEEEAGILLTKGGQAAIRARPNRAGLRCRQLERSRCAGRPFPPADLIDQLLRLLARLDVEAVGQQLAAALVLSDGGGPLSAEGQELHDLAVGAFLPGIHRYLPPGVRQRAVVGALPLIVAGQPMQRRQHQSVQVLTSEQHPLVELRTVGNGEAIQKGRPVERDGLLQGWEGRLGRGRLGNWYVGRRRACQLDEGGDIDRGGAGGVELEGFLGDQEVGGRGLVVADGLAQVGQGAAQVAAG